jgi:hypothetical protein
VRHASTRRLALALAALALVSAGGTLYCVAAA